PGDAGNEAVRLYGAQDSAGLRVDLMDPAIAMLADPERAFGPSHAGRAPIWCRDRREHTAAGRVDLLDAIALDLEEVPAVEGRARMGGHLERAYDLAAVGVDRAQCVAGRD